MVIYDGNYNFLGMSEELLQKLGYDDINEFASYHRDFAELFEKEDKLIYNFENFSWIDFVLYGGANKDRAIIKTKSGEMIDAKIKIDEIALKDEFGGVEKLYSVKIIEKGKLQSNETKEQKNKKISLRSMLSDLDVKQPEPPKETQPQVTQEPQNDEKLDINLSFMKPLNTSEEPQQINKIEEKTIQPEDTQTTKPSFSLDFLDQNKKEEPKESPKKDEVVLNFFNSSAQEEDKKEEKETNSFDLGFLNTLQEEKNTLEKPQELKLEVPTPKIEPKIEPKMEQKVEPKIDLNLDKEEKKEQELSIDLNFLKKETTQEPEPVLVEKPAVEPTIKIEEEPFTPNIDLNFLKIDKDEPKQQEPKIEIEKQAPQEPTEPSINLNFLKDINKQEDEPKVEIKPQEKQEAEPTINLNIEPIVKPKEEPKIEPKPEPKQEQEQGQEPLIDLNFLKMDKKEDTQQKQEPQEPTINLNFLKQENNTEQNKELSTQNKTQIIQQIKEDIKEIDTKAHDDDDITINEALKSVLNIQQKEPTKPKDEPKKQPQIKIELPKKQPKITIEQPQPQTTQSSSDSSEFRFLENFDITVEEKKEILKDFLSDANYNLSAIENFAQKGDVESIKYLCVKVKSSADILGLHKVTSALQQLETVSNIDEATKLIKTTKEQLDAIKSKL